MRVLEEFSEVTHSASGQNLFAEMGYSEHYKFKARIDLETNDIEEGIRELEFILQSMKNTLHYQESDMIG